jgi:hypothetical protein
VSYVPFNGNGVDLGEEVGLIYVGVLVGSGSIVLKIDLLGLHLLVVQKSSNLLHVDYSIDLPSCEFAQPVLAARVHVLLVHPALLPILREVLLLRLLLEERFFVLEGRRVYFDGISWDLYGQLI